MQSPVPTFDRGLAALTKLLAKAEAHCAERKIDPAVMVSARLFPDMFPLSRQVQIACDHAKSAPSRLAGIEAPRFADTEVTFEELRTRIASTAGFIAGIDPAAFADADGRTITFKVGPREMTFAGADYLPVWALPNFYFHMTTAYNILRHNGVALGKSDFLGG